MESRFSDSDHSDYLCVNHAYRKWDNVTVELSFSAEKNSFTSIVGPSGSGKSTVLRMIAGLLPAEKGTQILLDGKDITNLAPGKRGCGLVFQNGSLFLHMTVEDNIGYGLCCRGMKRKEARDAAHDFLRRFNLDGFSKRYPETLSGGEAQRVALARTLIVQPKLVLFDEPLSALDAPLRKKLSQDIRAMQQELGFTAIMVTHDINEAKTMSDTIILMEKGKKTWEGIPADFSETLMMQG